MRDQPPEKLTELLAELDLATAEQVQAMDRRARRLSRNLPRFESVWVDALAQARLLTPFQATQINAGRGRSLRIGPYVACRGLPSLGFASCYQARQVDSRQIVRLAVVEPPAAQAADMLNRLEALAAASESLQCDRLAPVIEVGADADRLLAACRYVGGKTAAEWMIHNGRFPPRAVLEIAQQMLAALSLLEERGLCHGDICLGELLLADGGRALPTWPGLRAAIRPAEGYAQTDLPPEAYDCLAPERITSGTPPTPCSEVYACGCLWWQMLAGRPPIPGGNGLGKMRAAQTAKIPDIRQLAPDTPEPLSEAISQCIRRDPKQRPQSIAQLAAMLGDTTRAGRTVLTRCQAQSPGRAEKGTRFNLCEAPSGPFRQIKPGPFFGLKQMSWWLVATAGCLAAAAAITWLSRYTGLSVPTAGIPASPSAVERVADPANEATPSSQSPDHNGSQQADHNRDKELVLGSGRPVVIEPSELRPGQCVRGEPGKRPLVRVPRGGLAVGVEGVRFQGIDFLRDHSARKGPIQPRPGDEPPAMIHLTASRAEFADCTFCSETAELREPFSFIRWTHPTGRDDSRMSLPSGQVRLEDCMLLGPGIGVNCQTIGAIAVELDNTLCLAGGPVIRLDHAPGADEPIIIGLSQVTLRGGGPLLECCHGQIDRPGTISIRAVGCVFAPDSQAAVLVFVGSASPNLPDGLGPLLARIRWSGQGSLVLPDTPIAQWRRPDGEHRVLDDSLVSIAGLVRSDVEFAGTAQFDLGRSDPAASRVVRWQAPIRSADPPGADPSRLPNMATIFQAKLAP